MNDYFYKNDLDIKVYHFQSVARIVFSRKNIRDRVQRDFLEKKKSKKILILINDLKKFGIKYPSNGILFFNHSMKIKEIDHFILSLKKSINRIFIKN